MKKWEFTVGVDVSKLTLDFNCAEMNEHIQVSNNSEGFTSFLKWCKSFHIDLSKSILVMEYTGGYEYKLIQFCEAKSILYTRISGLAIKKSLGICRGKNDKVDSKRIAQYGEEKYKSLVPAKPLNPLIIKLKDLLHFRKRLVRENASYETTIKERRSMYEAGANDMVIKMLIKKQKDNAKNIAIIEAELLSLIEEDEKIAFNYHLVTSIKGIGMVNALSTIVYTENFTSFSNARSYAVYVGVVPFDYSSGISIRGRKQVSHIANKELKQELNQAARSAIAWDQELKLYAEKKLEYKCYKIVLNNIKFKLILRMFAVVKRGERYVDRFKTAA